ncbi:MAG: thioredoxin family protein [Cyanobacteria bacterium P01_H01_bin.74]
MNPRASQPDLSGIKEVSPKALKPLLQTVNPASTPTVLFFNSKFCYDCKKMKPVIQQLADENQASLVVYPIDLLAPQKSDAPIISAIRPVTVPTLVFISETTKITTVLYNYQPEMALRDALSTIL